MGVNVEGGRRHISDPLRRVLSNHICFELNVLHSSCTVIRCGVDLLFVLFVNIEY